MATEILESIYLKQEREFSFCVVHDMVKKSQSKKIFVDIYLVKVFESPNRLLISK